MILAFLAICIPESIAAAKEAIIGICVLVAFNTISPVNLPVNVKKVSVSAFLFLTHF